MHVELSWADLAPRGRQLDEPALRAAVTAVVQGQVARFGDREPLRAQIEAAIDQAIVETAGPWAAGWRWSASEPGGGGLVRGWCCGMHSVLLDRDPDFTATVDRAVAAVLDWHAALVALDAMFAMLRVETASLPVAREVELAASRLLAFVIERTQAEDAWYNTFARTLSWYLEAAGVTDPAAHEAVADAIEGRFQSWVAPDEPTRRVACAGLGTAFGVLLGEDEPRDALADWCRVREQPIAIPPADRAPAGRDGHHGYIIEHDRARDPVRADRMIAALVLCRDAAAHGLALTFDQLADWQRVVLGAAGPVPFRTTDAFAKQGRECYRYRPDLREQFERALAGAGDPALPVAVRAARVYLDVCFFHPFADGNARAARLALDHVVTSAGLALRTAEPVFALARGADDPAGLWSLAFVVERSLGTL